MRETIESAKHGERLSINRCIQERSWTFLFSLILRPGDNKQRLKFQVADGSLQVKEGSEVKAGLLCADR